MEICGSRKKVSPEKMSPEENSPSKLSPEKKKEKEKKAPGGKSEKMSPMGTLSLGSPDSYGLRFFRSYIPGGKGPR